MSSGIGAFETTSGALGLTTLSVKPWIGRALPASELAHREATIQDVGDGRIVE